MKMLKYPLWEIIHGKCAQISEFCFREGQVLIGNSQKTTIRRLAFWLFTASTQR